METRGASSRVCVNETTQVSRISFTRMISNRLRVLVLSDLSNPQGLHSYNQPSSCLAYYLVHPQRLTGSNRLR